MAWSRVWWDAHAQRISGGDCERCKIGRVRYPLFMAGFGRSCDLCGWQPPGEPPPYEPGLDCYVPAR